MLNRIVMVVSLVLVGCGGGRYLDVPNQGSPCSASDTPRCASDGTVTYCVSGAWKDYDCYGTCGTNGRLCGWEEAREGYDCAELAYVYGGCASTSRSATCVRGKILVNECPGGCSETGGSVGCSQ